MNIHVREAGISSARTVNVSKLIDGSAFNYFTGPVAVICFLAIVFDGLDVSLFGTVLPVLMRGPWRARPLILAAEMSASVTLVCIALPGIVALNDAFSQYRFPS